MLFDSPGRRSALNDQSPKGSIHRESRSNIMIRRKKLACIGLAASMALPTGLANFGRLFADQTGGPAGAGDSQAKPNNADLLKAGIDQYNQGQYEQSVATLQEVDIKSLSDQDHQTLVDVLSKANEAATERRDARTELLQGDEARKANHLLDAEQDYNAVLSNPRRCSEPPERPAAAHAACVRPEGRISRRQIGLQAGGGRIPQGALETSPRRFHDRPAIGIHRRIPPGQPLGISPEDGPEGTEVSGQEQEGRWPHRIRARP